MQHCHPPGRDGADQVLVYGLAGLASSLPGLNFYYTLGAGVELAVADNVSVFSEIAPYRYFGGSPIFWRASAGLNWHLGN